MDERSRPRMPSVAPPGLFPDAPYTYATIVPAGTLLFTAGACPIDELGVVVDLDDHEAQAGRALANLLATLAAAGAGPQDLVRTTVYVVGGHADLVRVWQVVESGLAPHRPPSTLLGVTVLGYRDQLVEIDAVASLPG